MNARIGSQKTRSLDAIEKWNEELSIREVEEVAADLPIVIMHTSKGPIELELFEDHAPNTVANFISLADSGYYDGIRFHRVIPKFMVQGGNPAFRGDESDQSADDGPGYSIKDEHTNEDYRNHFAGSLSMAKTAEPNSGGSQFFLTHLPTPHLDGRHTVFGRITSGLDTARAIEQDDEIITILIVRKREHAYTPDKIGEKVTEIIPKDGVKLMTSPKSDK
ncbi:MAG TPA: peptidylprolyl isomerase [Phycisphaerales bacterium]|nr:peptidylprolyl isomerase [Phycisphaerales bacterium]